MTREEAIKGLKVLRKDFSGYKPNEEMFDMAIEALEQEPKWIPVTWHEIAEEERAENGYPKDWVVFMDCEMPSDGQEILVTTRYGTVEKDMCYEDIIAKKKNRGK